MQTVCGQRSSHSRNPEYYSQDWTVMGFLVHSWPFKYLCISPSSYHIDFKSTYKQKWLHSETKTALSWHLQSVEDDTVTLESCYSDPLQVYHQIINFPFDTVFWLLYLVWLNRQLDPEQICLHTLFLEPLFCCFYCSCSTVARSFLCWILWSLFQVWSWVSTLF